eukprot:m.117795 g.117795  ORF g.117795 m.117795 type:complete len:328 (-) comp12881_c0_seq4:2002-2985(-)
MSDTNTDTNTNTNNDGSNAHEGHRHHHQNENVVMLRVFAEHAIYSPGVSYKSVPASQETTASEVIQMVLDKFGEMEPASRFELRYVRISSKTGKVKRRSSLMKIVKGSSEFSISLEDDICPVLFAEWYSDEPRRFELHRKEEVERPTIGARKRSSVFASFKRKSKSRHHVPQPPSTIQLPLPHIPEHSQPHQQQQLQQQHQGQIHTFHTAHKRDEHHSFQQQVGRSGERKQHQLKLVMGPSSSRSSSSHSIVLDHEPSRHTHARKQHQYQQHQHMYDDMSSISSPFTHLQGIQQLSSPPSVASRSSTSSARSDRIRKARNAQDHSTV